jgi:predicted amidohydrolase
MRSLSVIRLGLVQMLVKPGDPEGNLGRARERVAEAARGGARVIVLPEAMDCGWTHPSARELAGPIPGGATCSALVSMAKANGVYLCSGLVERAGERLFNAAVLIDPSGGILLHHRKLNELEIAHDLYAQGDRLGVARTPLGTFGLMICADGFAAGEVVGRTLGLMGADVILSPSAWAVPGGHDNEKEPYGKLWRDCYGAVAREYGVWIVGVSNVGAIPAGPWAGRKCIGCSLVVGPDGEPVLRGPYGEGEEAILYVDITPQSRGVRGSSWGTGKARERRI